MPYIRMYSRDVPLDEKRVLAQKLISITLQTFNLRPEERDQITIQFLPRHPYGAPEAASSRTSDVMIEVSDRDLTVEKITAFIEAAAPMVTRSVAVRATGRLAQRLGIRTDSARQVAFQFSQTDARTRKTVCDPISKARVRKAA